MMCKFLGSVLAVITLTGAAALILMLAFGALYKINTGHACEHSDCLFKAGYNKLA